MLEGTGDQEFDGSNYGSALITYKISSGGSLTLRNELICEELVLDSSVTGTLNTSSMDIAVEEDNLSQAIGRGGQNIRLASELTEWMLNVMSVEQAEEKNEEEAQTLQKNVFGTKCAESITSAGIK